MFAYRTQKRRKPIKQYKYLYKYLSKTYLQGLLKQKNMLVSKLFFKCERLTSSLFRDPPIKFESFWYLYLVWKVVIRARETLNMCLYVICSSV